MLGYIQILYVLRVHIIIKKSQSIKNLLWDFGAGSRTLFSAIEQSTGLFSQICPARRCTANLEIRPTVPKICFRLGAPTNFDRSAVLFALFISHCERSQTNRFNSPILTKNTEAGKSASVFLELMRGLEPLTY